MPNGKGLRKERKAAMAAVVPAAAAAVATAGQGRPDGRSRRERWRQTDAVLSTAGGQREIYRQEVSERVVG